MLDTFVQACKHNTLNVTLIYYQLGSGWVLILAYMVLHMFISPWNMVNGCRVNMCLHCPHSCASVNTIQHIPEHVVLASSSLLPQSLVPSQSHRFGMQRLLLHLNWSVGQVWLSAKKAKKKSAIDVVALTWDTLKISNTTKKEWKIKCAYNSEHHIFSLYRPQPK